MRSKQQSILKKLKSLAKTAQKFSEELNEIISMIESQESEEKKHHGNANESKTAAAEEISIEMLKEKTRDEAIELLKAASQKQLSKLFRELGGSSRDARKRRDYLTERILWNLYDFQEGHSILKETKK